MDEQDGILVSFQEHHFKKALEKIADVANEVLPKPQTDAEMVLWATLDGCIRVAEKALLQNTESVMP